MRSFALWLAVLPICVATRAQAGALEAPSHVRAALDDDSGAPLKPLD